MKAELAEIVLAGIDRVFKELGAESFDDAVQFINDTKPGPRRIGVAVAMELLPIMCGRLSATEAEGIITDAQKYPSREALRRALLDAPEPEPAEWRELERAKAIPRELREALKKLRSDIRPTGGRPKLIGGGHATEYKKIVRAIEKWHTQDGQTKTEAKERAAAKWGCRMSTINGIWRQRKMILSEPE